MRAAVTRLRAGGGREKVFVTDWPEPDPPKGGEFRTQTLYSGITNGTERNDLLGGNYATPDEELPAGWGYQNVGRVVEVGESVETVSPGDIFYLSADHMEYVVTAEGGLYVRLPETVDPREAALFGMASVAMRSCRNADLRLGEQVLIVGAGCIGQFAAQIGAAMGAEVTLCDVDETRLALAREIGAAAQTVVVPREDWEGAIPRKWFDAVIDLAGVPGSEDRILTAVRPRGRVSFIAGRDTLSYTFNLGQWREVTIKHNSHFEREDLELLTRLVERGAVTITPLLREVAPIADAKRVYDVLRDDPGRLLGTVFAW